MSQKDLRTTKSNKPAPPAAPARSASFQSTIIRRPTQLGRGTTGPVAPKPDPACPAPVSQARSGPAHLPRVGATIGHYEIIRELGRGGMGVVFLARDIRLARRVAIKFLLTEPGLRTERFLAEARTTARCHHENIVIIYEVGEHCESPYMVLEYLRGQTLRQLLDKHPLSPQRAVELMLPVVRALHRAHRHSIAHRDLKPANVFITDEGAVKVLDFGIAKLLSELAGQNASFKPTAVPEEPELARFTRTGALVGTVPYMSPEQMRGDAVDHRTDLWAAGIMLYEMVLGAHPAAPLHMSRLLAIAEGEPVIPSAQERLPRIGELGAIIDRCLIANRDDRTASAGDLLAELESCLESFGPRRRLRAVSSDQSPFAGLAAFQEADAERFYGRSHETASLLTRLRSEPLVTVVGPSGTGKSSLIRAGVIPALKQSGEGWHAVVMRPGRQPLAALADSLAYLTARATNPSAPAQPTSLASGSSCDEPVLRLQKEPGTLGAGLRRWAGRRLRRVLLFVDQLEELYTQGAGADERIAFMRCLEGAADDATAPVRVIATIRSDFLERAIHDRGLMTDATRGLVFLPPMTRVGLRQALIAPVEACGHDFESAELVEDMLDALEESPGALPLLQSAAAKLWDTRDCERRLLTRKSYDAMGGIAGTLASHADTVLAAVTERQLSLARAIFECLVTPERTRAIATLGELCQLPGDPEEIDQVVHHLCRARLLNIEDAAGDRRDRASATVELIHESLITGWPTLRRWLDENQDDAEFLARLRTASKEWQKSGRSDGMLWRGDIADEALNWRRRNSRELAQGEQSYLDAVFALATSTARRKRRILYGTIAGLTALLAAAAVAIVWILQTQSQVDQQSQTIHQQKQKLELQEQLKRVLKDARTARDAAEREKKRADAERDAAEAARQLAEREAARAKHSAEQAQRARQEAEAERARAQASAAAARRAEARARDAEAAAKNSADTEREARKQVQALTRRQKELLRKLGIKEPKTR